MAEEKILLNIKLDVAETNSKLAKLKTEISSLTEENKKLAVAAKAASLAGDSAQLAALNNQIVKNETSVRGLASEQRNLRNQLDISSKANSAQAGSYEQLLRQQQLAQIQLKTMEGTLRRNADGTIVLTDAYVKQSQIVREAKEAIISFDQGIKDGRTNVGNYSSSFQDAIQKTGLFDGALGTLRGSADKVKAGLEVVKQGGQAVASGFDSGAKAIKGITVEIGNSISAFNSWATSTQKSNDAITETFTTATRTEQAVEGLGKAGTTAATEVEAVGAAGMVAGQGVAAGSAIGVSGMTALKVAIASTGIGLLLIALGSLVAFFAKSEKAAELLERAMAGIGAVIDVVVDTAAKLGEFLFNAFSHPKEALLSLANFIKDNLINRFKGLYEVAAGLLTLDLGRIGNGLAEVGTGVDNLSGKIKNAGSAMSEYAKRIAEAANEAARLKGEQQELEDRTRQHSVEINNNNNLISKALKLSKDATIPIKDRIAALEDAGEREKRNSLLLEEDAKKQFQLDIQKIVNVKNLSNAEKQRFTELVSSQVTLSLLDQQELDRIQEKGIISDNELQKLAESNIKTNNIIAEQTETRLLISKRQNKFEQDELKRALTAQLGILDNSYKQQQLEGKQNFEVLRQIAAQERTVSLTDDELSAKQKEKIESDYQLKLSEIKKQEIDFNKSIQNQIIDSQLSLIADGKTREISQEIAGFNRKLEAIIGNSQAEIALRESLTSESAIKILAIEEKYRQQDRKEAIDLITKKSKEENEAVASKYSEKENQLKIALSKEQITREQFESNKIALVAAKLSDELIILKKQQQDRQVIDQQYFIAESQKLFDAFQNKKITEEQFNQQLIELQKAQKKIELQTLEETQAPITAKEKEIVQTKVDVTIKGNDQIIADQRRTAEAEYNLNQTRLDLAGTLVTGFKNILSQDEANRKKYGDVIKGIAIAEIEINLVKELSAIYEASAANPLNKVTAGGVGLAQSALLGGIAIAKAALATQAVIAQKFDKGGMTSTDYITLNEAVNKYNPSYTSTLSGYYSKPTMSLVAEKAPEWVSPNWMVEHPKSKPIIQSLERFRTSGVLAFADGGFAASSLSSPVINQIEISEQLRSAFSQLPTPVVIVQDINEAQGTVVKVEDRATI